MPRGNRDNLMPVQSNEEARSRGRNGGKKSGEVRREKRRLRDCAQLLLSLPVADVDNYNKIAELGIQPEDIDNRMLMVTALVARASVGDVNAAKEVRSILGEDEYTEDGDKTHTYQGLPARVLGRAYVDINRDIDNNAYTYYDFKGGRGSLKSSFCALKIIDRMMTDDACCALAVRQVKDTLKDSVFSQLVWAIDELGLTEQFHCTKNPMEIKRKDTKQVIYFRGADDPMKIKSLRPPKDKHIGIIWIEEYDQLHGAETVRNILQSAMRGGDNAIVFRSYNTPITQSHFVNQETAKPDPNRIVHHSFYYEAPTIWLGQKFIDLAEHTKHTNELAYRHEYLGEAVGTGGSVFTNVTLCTITDEDIDSFDRCYYGLDWGYFPDPNHFCECYFNAAQQRLWIYGEIRRYKTGNPEMAGILEDWKDCTITADSSESKSVNDFNSYGFQMRKAIKGPGSVKYSMKWLASLPEIIIDNVRCPHTAEEFQGYEYERTKNGEVISGYPDKDNHAIDAVRYALESIWRSRWKGQ